VARKVNTFEGGTSGTTITAANSGGASGDAFDIVLTGGSFTNAFSNAQAMHGTLSLRQAGGSASQAHFRWDFAPAVDRMFFRFYFRTPTISTARSLVQLRVSSAQVLRVALSGSALVVNDAANGLLDTSTGLSGNTWYRVEGDVQQSTGNVTINIYAGDSLTTLDVLTATGASIGTADYEEIRFGQIANATGLPDLFFDSLDANDVGLPGPWLQTVAPGGIASAEAFGTALITLAIVPGGIASGEAFGSATVTQTGGTQTIIPGGIASAEAFGTAAISRTISPTGIPSAEAFGTARIDFVIAVGGIPSAEAFGTATISVTISPTGIGSAEAFGTATVTTGSVNVAPGGIPSGEAFGGAVVSTGAFVVQPTGIPSGEAFGSPTVTTGPVSVAPTGIPSDEAFGTALIGSFTVIDPGGIGSGEAFGTPTLTLGAAVVSPGGIPSEEAFGDHAVTVVTGPTVQMIFPIGIPSAGTVRPPTVTVLAGALCVCVEIEGVVAQFGNPVVTVMS
jgi:hypothetical protein